MTSALGYSKGLFVAAALVLGGWPQQQAPPPKPPEPRPAAKRVRVDLSGFELAPQPPAQSSTQLGGGTRSLAGGDPAPLAPNVGRTFSATPLFAWRHSSQAQKFEFRLFDQAGAVVHRAAVTGREFTYPSDAPPLQPGVAYQWSVQPQSTMLGGASTKATVMRLSEADLAAVSAQLAHLPAGVTEAEWRAQVFTERRLWYDAIAAWSALIERFPNRADLHEKRGQIYDQIPVTQDLADEDFAAAQRLRAGAR